MNRDLRRWTIALLSTAAFVAAPVAYAGTWQPLANPIPAPDIVDSGGNVVGPGGAGAPLLLTDGSVLVFDVGLAGSNGRVLKLTPDQNGSYVNGTWTELAQMPYAPIAASEAVLADGRVIVEGGEYTDLNNFTLTNQGAIYDPVANSWTSVPPPLKFRDVFPPRRKFAPHPIGDAANVVLADGTFMVEDKMSRQDAILHLKTLTWSYPDVSTKADLNDEEGLTLLPDGTVLTVDCYTDLIFGHLKHYPPDPTNSEIFDPRTRTWSSGGSTINSLTDRKTFEMGIAMLRPDGTVFATGTQGYTSIYDTRSHTWSVGPRIPTNSRGKQFTMQDAAAALLPSGNVLFTASGGLIIKGHDDHMPLHFFEFDGTGYIDEPSIPNAKNDGSYSVNLLPLPDGRVLSVDETKDVEIYTPDASAPNSDWAPVVNKVKHKLTPGATYRIRGIRFNGMSQACAFGDEAQCATNYPLVRITNVATGHVFYSRTHDHTSMAVASPDEVATFFDVPANQEAGASTLEVVANGIASQPASVRVTSVPAHAVPMLGTPQLRNTNRSGHVAVLPDGAALTRRERSPHVP
jgi:hypothetical protein